MDQDPAARRYALPLVQPTHPLKRMLKPMVGRVVCALLGSRARDLEAGRGPDRLDFLDRLMMSALLDRARQRGTLDEFTLRQQQRFWSSEEAANFHQDHEHYFDQWFLGPNQVTIRELERLAQEGHYTTLCEIGCGNGRALDYFAGRLPTLQRLVGIDLSRAQIEHNRGRYQDPRLEWIDGDAAAWIEANAQPGWIYVSNNGVLEYFLQVTLETMFRQIAARAQPALVCLMEPVDTEHDLEADGASRPYGSERSFSHNYPRMLLTAGFELLHQSELHTPPHRLLRLIARTG